MNIERIKRLLERREGIRLEFKKCTDELPGNLFDTICSMLNREGGDILLGVTDNGTIQGIKPFAIGKLISNIVNQSNNPQKLNPPFILFPQEYVLDTKHFLHIQVPASSQVHKSNGLVYDRSNDGDFRVTQPHRVAEIYNRKRLHYTEGTIYRYINIADFKEELFTKIRNLIKSNNENHPWLALENQQLLKKSGLWKHDYQSGEEGYTLAAVLLFGKDDVIKQILPHYKIDALVRIKNISRYDDREYIESNLIESYEKLMDFVAKHLPDNFYMIDDQRVNLRTKIFREIIANLIIHREYTNALPATFTIFNDKVVTENANNPHGIGPITLENFAPFPKNPAISKFFIQLGRVDELGSGMLNVNRYYKEYGGIGKPEFIEGNSFKTIIPIPDIADKVKFYRQNIEHITQIVKEPTIDIVKYRKNDTVNHANDTANRSNDTVNHANDTANRSNDTVNRSNDTVNDILDNIIKNTVKNLAKNTVKKRVIKLIFMLNEHPGMRSKELANKLRITETTVRRDMQKLTKVIQYKGAFKTGGYYLTHKMQKIVENILLQ